VPTFFRPMYWKITLSPGNSPPKAALVGRPDLEARSGLSGIWLLAWIRSPLARPWPRLGTTRSLEKTTLSSLGSKCGVLSGLGSICLAIDLSPDLPATMTVPYKTIIPISR